MASNGITFIPNIIKIGQAVIKFNMHKRPVSCSVHFVHIVEKLGKKEMAYKNVY